MWERGQGEYKASLEFRVELVGHELRGKEGEVEGGFRVVAAKELVICLFELRDNSREAAHNIPHDSGT